MKLKVQTHLILTPTFYQAIVGVIANIAEANPHHHLKINLCTICGAMKPATSREMKTGEAKILLIDQMSNLDPCQVCLSICGKYPELWQYLINMSGFQKHNAGVSDKPLSIDLSINNLNGTH